jgi:hypothetical protein
MISAIVCEPSDRVSRLESEQPHRDLTDIRAQRSAIRAGRRAKWGAMLGPCPTSYMD